MIIKPQASNAVDIELENGEIITIHESNNALSFSAMPNHLRVTAHNVKTMERDILGDNYQLSIQVIPSKYED